MKALNTFKLFKDGFKDTFEIAGHYLKHILSTRKGKITAVIASVFILSFNAVVFNLPYALIALMSRLDSNNHTRDSISQILINAQKDDGFQVALIFFWSLLLSSVFVPIVSNSILSIYNKNAMSGIRVNDTHQITDSILLQFISVITIVEFLLTIGISSLLIFNFNYSPVVYIYAISFWVFFTIITCFNAWLVEWVLRKFKTKGKVILISFELLSLAVLWIFVGEPFYNLFGIPQFFIDSLNNVSFMWIQILVMLLASFLISLFVVKLGTNVLNNHMPFVSNKKAKQISFVPTISVVNRIFWRNGNIKTPVMMMFVVSLLSVMLMGNSVNTLMGFVIALPLVISMSFMVNIFGIVGSGNSWIFSVTKYSSGVLKFFSLYAMGIAMLMNIALALTALIFNNISLELFIGFITSTFITVILMTLFSLLYSTRRPSKYDAHIRGENILSPMQAIAVLVLLIVFGGVLGIVAFNFIALEYHIAILGILLILFMYVVDIETKRLSKDNNINNIITITS